MVKAFETRNTRFKSLNVQFFFFKKCFLYLIQSALYFYAVLYM